MTATDQSRDMLRIAALAADAKGGEDLVALDVSGPLPLVDIFLLVTGRSERNVAAIADEIEDKLQCLLAQGSAVRNVLQLDTSPDFKPVMNQRVRCAEVPWVNESSCNTFQTQEP